MAGRKRKVSQDSCDEDRPPPPRREFSDFETPCAQDVTAMLEKEVEAELELNESNHDTTANDVDDVDDVDSAVANTTSMQAVVGILAALAEPHGKRLVVDGGDIDDFMKASDESLSNAGTALPLSVLFQSLSPTNMQSACIAVVLDKLSRMLRQSPCKTLHLSVRLK